MNYKRHKLYTILILSGVFMISLSMSCDKDSDTTTIEAEFDSKEHLTNVYVNGILPLNNQLTNQAQLLSASVNLFSTETTEGNLELVQKEWREFQEIWKQLELYDLGAIANSFISFEINRWPTDIIRIEQNIRGTEDLIEEFIASIGSSSKGISAIEYLIFSLDSNTEVLTKFTTDENAAGRKKYLLALSENLYTKSLTLKNLWETNEENFINALENGISGSQNQLVNAMVALIEEIMKSKLGAPLGDTNGGTVDPKQLEAYYGAFSKEIIQQHLKTLQNCFTGDFGQAGTQVGFDDLLIFRDHKNVADKIVMQFSVCQDKLDAISGKLRDDIVTKEEEVMALKNSFRDLLVLLKVDMASILGTTITFNDSDGD
ncbi:imelysin family protein [Aquimarina sp. 2201CG1-2-11]|uniref:imelysin family protein n=1 Tax=Aquimarina discodermiae TaxID=3231043 RepID=UPI003462956D